MARGDGKKASAYEYNKGLGAYNHNSDTIAWAIVTDTYASIDANAATLNMSNLTVVASAGAYTSGTSIANKTWTQSGARSVLDGDDISIAANASNPITGRCMAFYNDTSATDDVIGVTDLTTDGTTAVDLTSGLTVTLAATGLADVEVNA